MRKAVDKDSDGWEVGGSDDDKPTNLIGRRSHPVER